MTDHDDQPPVEPTHPAMSEVNDLKPTKTSGFAVASFALGIAALFTCGLTSPLGFIFGILAIIQIRTRRTLPIGRFYAISGTAINAIAMVLWIYIGSCLSWIPFEGSDRTHLCASNLKQIGTAMHMYMNDNDSYLPTSDKWVDQILPYIRGKHTRTCPSAWRVKIGYAMNKDVSGISENVMSDLSSVVVFFDSIPTDNPYGGTELLPSPERHILSRRYDSEKMDQLQPGGKKEQLRVNNFCFTDGHVGSMTANQVHSMIWNPIKK